MEFKNIAIVGLGVMGGSFAKAIKKAHFKDTTVSALDLNQDNLTSALNEGTIVKGETFNQTILQTADLVIFTLYPKDLLPFLKKHQQEFKKGALLTDVTGVKGHLFEKLFPLLPKNVEFLLGHPMAGKESQGYEFSSGTIFQKANYLLLPTEKNTVEKLTAYEAFIKALGFKRIEKTTPEVHDEMIAFTSQLPHILSVSLINSDQHQQATSHFIGDSYRELTRIANINGPLWEELFFANQQELLLAMENFEKEWFQLKKALQEKDSLTLQKLLKEAKEKRLELEQTDLKLNP